MDAIRLCSIEQLPRTVPAWDSIVEDLGHPPAERIAAALDVGRSTVYRWHAAHQAPRVAALALFWLTRWGRSAVHTQATNDATMAVQYARALTEERLQLRDQVRQLEDLNRRLQLGLIVALPEVPEPDADARSSALLKNRQARSLALALQADQRAGTSVVRSTVPPAMEDGAAQAGQVLTVERPGTPASAAVATLPSHGGYRPHPPAWVGDADARLPGLRPPASARGLATGGGAGPCAPPEPGFGAFAALSNACTHQRRNA